MKALDPDALETATCTQFSSDYLAQLRSHMVDVQVLNDMARLRCLCRDEARCPTVDGGDGSRHDGIVVRVRVCVCVRWWGGGDWRVRSWSLGA